MDFQVQKLCNLADALYKLFYQRWLIFSNSNCFLLRFSLRMTEWHLHFIMIEIEIVGETRWALSEENNVPPLSSALTRTHEIPRSMPPKILSSPQKNAFRSL